jgi:hypothetical protein
MIVPGKVYKTPGKFWFFYIQQPIAYLCIGGLIIYFIEPRQHTSFIQLFGSIFIAG